MTQEQFKGYGAENISEIAAFARPYLEHRIDLYKKYARKLNENQFMGEGDAGKIVVAFEYYIVNMVQGYLGGKSPMYSVSRPSDYTLSKNERGIIRKKHQIRSEKPLPGRSQDIVMSEKKHMWIRFGSN